jgi:hypothetical protein
MYWYSLLPVLASLWPITFIIGFIILGILFFMHLVNYPSFMDVGVHMGDLESEDLTTTIKVKVDDKYETFEPGWHSVWFGLESNLWNLGWGHGIAYTAGLVKNIKINGISPPEKPRDLSYPSTGHVGDNIEIKLKSLDYNNDQVKYIAKWTENGQEKTSQSSFYNSDQEATLPVFFQNPGVYTLTIYAEDKDRQKSESQEITITINEDTNPPTTTITSPIKGFYLNGKKIFKNSPNPPLIIGDIRVDADADDQEGIKMVEFKCNGHKYYSDTNEPYSALCQVPNMIPVLSEFRTVAKDYAGNIGSDKQNVWYFNKGIQTMTATKTNTPAFGNDENEQNSDQIKYHIVSKNDSLTTSEIQQGVNKLRQILNNDFNGATITYIFKINYGDDSPEEIIEKDYPILEIDHDYDEEPSKITITLTTKLTIDGETYTDAENHQLTLNGPHKSKSTKIFNYLKGLSERFPLLGKIFNLLFQIK